MHRVLVLLLLFSCSTVTLFFTKFSPTKEGLKKAFVRLRSNIKECNQSRPPWRNDIKYRVKYTVLINKDGETEKQYLQSLPDMIPSLKGCLYKELRKVKFKESNRANKVSVVFNLNEV